MFIGRTAEPERLLLGKWRVESKLSVAPFAEYCQKSTLSWRSFRKGYACAYYRSAYCSVRFRVVF